MSNFLSRCVMINSAVAIVGASFMFGMPSLAQAKIMDCAGEYKYHYLKNRGHKAMAVTGGKSPFAGGISCGTAWNYATVEEAINEALRQCRVSDRKFNDPGICQIVKVK
jgi:hypothetical protein